MGIGWFGQSTDREVGHVRFATFLIAGTGIAALAGCAVVDPSHPTDARAVNTGAFPTFAAVPAAANAQLPDAEAERAVMSLEDEAAMVAAVPRPMGVEARIAQAERAGAAAQANAPIPLDERLRLRRLGETHAERTLRRIKDR